jgi:hypothetical protein
MTEPTVVASSAATSPSTWNGDVLTELLGLQSVRAVLFTNGKGHALHVTRRRPAPPELAKLVDLAHAALVQTGNALQLGRIEVSASVYHAGVLLLAGSGAVRVAVLADPGANLGALLNQVRRVLRKEEP